MRCINSWQTLIRFQRDVAAHLARYELIPGNCYQRLVQALGSKCAHVLWVSLNYDFLFEQALWIEGLRVTHDVIAEGGTDVRVLKPHGSATFLPDIGNMVLQGNEAYGFAGGPAPFMFNPPIRFECNADYDSVIQRLKAWYGDERFREMAPVIAQYAYGKRFTSNTNWAERANRLLAHRLAAATDVYLIGVRLTLEDTHVWEPLRRSGARIWVINPTFDDYECWAKGRASSIRQLADRFNEIDKIHSSIEAQLDW